MPSVIISVWMPRSFFSLRKPKSACGMLADAQLEGGAVLDERGDVLGNLPASRR